MKKTGLVLVWLLVSLLAAAQATENVASTYNNTYLHTHLGGFLNLPGILIETLYVDAVTLFTHQALA